MSYAILEKFTYQMLHAQPGRQANFIWQGGEPTLMGLDFYQNAVKLQEDLAPPGIQVNNLLQTNGTKLTADWCRFFRDHDFLIGISVDGPPEMHNAYRHDHKGYPCFDQVYRAVTLLQEYAVHYNILCCVHPKNVEQPLKVYRYFVKEMGAHFIQFIPIVQRKFDQIGETTRFMTESSVNPQAYGEFLIAIFKDWRSHDIGNIFVQNFEVILGRYLGQPAGLCVFAPTCGRALIIEHNGDIFSCDHFVNRDHYLGNITQTSLVDLVDSEKQAEFGQNKFNSLSERCLTCDMRWLCHGGCPKNRDDDGLNLLCDGYQLFFRYIDEPMREIAARILGQSRT